MPHLDRDSSGNPILLAEPRRRPIPREDLPEIVTPDGTSGPAEWGRYHDAVREAARSFDSPEEGDIHQFLQARARSPERVDVPAFHEAVKRQRMADLVDIVDHHIRRDASLPRGARMVRVQAPRGYMRRALRKSSPEDLAHLRHRLVSIGHDDDSVRNYLSSRVSGDLWDQAATYEVAASDSEFSGLEFDDTDNGFDGDDGVAPEIAEIIAESVAKAVEKFSPTINVYVDSQAKPE